MDMASNMTQPSFCARQQKLKTTGVNFIDNALKRFKKLLQYTEQLFV
jgi:hypothetical protein